MDAAPLRHLDAQADHAPAGDVAVATHIHDRVVPRLCGVARVLAAEGELGRELRERCHDEVTAALLELRAVVLGSVGGHEGDASLATEVRRWRARGVPLRFTSVCGGPLPPPLEALACDVLAEAVRNAARHARPSEVQVRVVVSRRRVTLLVVNDGLARRGAPAAGLGLGLRLAAATAAQHGGSLEWGRVEEETWRVRLRVPIPNG